MLQVVVFPTPILDFEVSTRLGSWLRMDLQGASVRADTACTGDVSLYTISP